jgi:hypothetical protein
MGAHVARVDPAALIEVAGRYDAVAALVDTAVRTHLSSLSFGGAVAGRAHGAQGAALRQAVDGIVAALRSWSRGATGIADGLRESAVRYAEAEARAARRVG